MRAIGLAVWMLALAACVTEEAVEPPTGDTAGSGASDTSDAGIDDTSVDDTADTNIDDTADTNLDDTADTTVDVEDCMLGCGVGCPAPEFQICGTDGNLYCNSCYYWYYCY